MSTKKLSTDAAYALGEEAFRAGFKAGAGPCWDVQDEERAWADYEPSEDVKELIDG